MYKSLLQFVTLFILLMVAWSVIAQESPSVILNTDYYNATRYPNARKIARTSDGTLMVVWEPNGSPSKEVHYSIFDPVFEAWNDPVQLTNSEADESATPAIVADGNGNIYASWKEEESSDVSRRNYKFAKWDGAAWTAPVLVEDDTSNCGYGSMALAPNGDIFIAYTVYGTKWGPQHPVICWSKDDGVTWDFQMIQPEKTEMSGNFIEPCLTHTTDGNMLCAWYDEPDPANKTESDSYPLDEIMMSTFDGTSWSDPVAVTPMVADGDTLGCQHPTMETDSEMHVHIVYVSEGTHVVHGVLTDGKITSTTQIDASADTMGVDRPCMSIDENDNLYVVWQEETSDTEAGSVDNVFYSVSADGGQTWSTPVQMSNCEAEDGGGHSTERASIADRVVGPIEGTFEGGADVMWAQFNADSEGGWDLWYYRIPMVTTGVKNSQPSQPLSYSLAQNYPNPFNPDTEISFTLAKTAKVELTIYNTLGQKVKTLVNRTMNANTHKVSWDGTDEYNNVVTSGIYFYQIKSNNFSATKRMVFLR